MKKNMFYARKNKKMEFLKKKFAKNERMVI